MLLLFYKCNVSVFLYYSAFNRIIFTSLALLKKNLLHNWSFQGVFRLCAHLVPYTTEKPALFMFTLSSKYVF